MKRFGFLDRAVDYLKEAGMEVQLFRESSLTRQSRLLCAEQKRWKSSSRTGS